MTEADKKLLIQDVCARIPYGIYLHVERGPFPEYICPDNISDITEGNLWKEIKPYLRPLSSMTENEYDYNYRLFEGCSHSVVFDTKNPKNFKFGDLKTYTLELLDWLLANHFDFRGLIEKGLAIEVTEENNPYKS